MLMLRNFHLWHKVAANAGRMFRQIVFNMSYIIINWKTLSSMLDPDWIFFIWVRKYVIRLLIANLWSGLIIVGDEEKSSIYQKFSSNQGLMRKKGSSAQSEDQKFEGFIFFSLWPDQLNLERRQEFFILSFFASNIHHNLFQFCHTLPF